MSDIVYIRTKYKEITGNANADDVPIYAMKQVVKAYDKGRTGVIAELKPYVLTNMDDEQFLWLKVDELNKLSFAEQLKGAEE